MKVNILLTGSTGFVGKFFLKYFNDIQKFEITTWSKDDFLQKNLFLNSLKKDLNVIVHLAGKSHDLKKSLDSDQYFKVNTELTKRIFDSFLLSEAKLFIMFSSVKAVADVVEDELTEEHIPCPVTHYGKSKLQAEKYIFSKIIPKGKRVVVLRPCMIHGPGNKGNLNLLFKVVSMNFPWPLGSFENRRSFCSIDNLMFVLGELMKREDIPSGIYNMADDEALSTNELIGLIALSQNKKLRFLRISKWFIEFIAGIGDKLSFPLNTERLQKLTSSYVVSNSKIKTAIGKPFPVSSRDGFLKTFKSFNE